MGIAYSAMSTVSPAATMPRAAAHTPTPSKPATPTLEPRLSSLQYPYRCLRSRLHLQRGQREGNNNRRSPSLWLNYSDMKLHVLIKAKSHYKSMKFKGSNTSRKMTANHGCRYRPKAGKKYPANYQLAAGEQRCRQQPRMACSIRNRLADLHGTPSNRRPFFIYRRQALSSHPIHK